MQFQTQINQFLQHGYFLCSPYLKKVWCLLGSTHNSFSKKKSEKQNYFYRNNFYSSIQDPWVTGTDFYELDIKEFFSIISLQSSQALSIEWEKPSYESYAHFFRSVKRLIDNKSIQKAVPFAQQSGATKFNQSNLVHCLQELSKLQKNKTIFLYGYWDLSKNYMQLGASPELLFVKEDQILRTIALAGTSQSPNKDFKEDKMHDEHEYVVSDLSNSLKKYGLVQKGPSYAVKYSQYYHKKTEISVDCSNSDPDFESLLGSVYPSAAIGAYPRKKGLDFLFKIEKKLHLNRGFFACPFGIHTKDNIMLCISAIRGIEWSNGKVTVTAGGGIVVQSNLASEWDEIILKIGSIKSVFGLI